VKKKHILYSIPIIMLLTLGAGFNSSASNDNEPMNIMEINIDEISSKHRNRISISPYITSEDIPTNENIVQPIFRVTIKYVD
jgi:hypothetical protein